MKKSGTMGTKKRKDLDRSASRRSVMPQAFCCVFVCLFTSVYELGTDKYAGSGNPCDGVASHPGGSENTAGHFMARKLE